MFRILCSCKKDLTKLFLNAEIVLFEYRLNTLNEIELRKLLKELNKYSVKLLNYNRINKLNDISKSIIEQIANILMIDYQTPKKRLKCEEVNLQETKITQLLNEYLYLYPPTSTMNDEDSLEIIDNLFIKVPFEHALGLLRKRECLINKSIETNISISP